MGKVVKMFVLRNWIVGKLHKYLIIGEKIQILLSVDSFQAKHGSNYEDLSKISSALKVCVGFPGSINFP